MSFIFQLLSRNIRKDLVNRSALLWPLIAVGDETPGVTFSVATADPDAARAAAAAAVPLRRLGRPDEFGRVAAFMLSDAASYVTGSMIAVDGGVQRAL